MFRIKRVMFNFTTTVMDFEILKIEDIFIQEKNQRGEFFFTSENKNKYIILEKMDKFM